MDAKIIAERKVAYQPPSVTRAEQHARDAARRAEREKRAHIRIADAAVIVDQHKKLKAQEYLAKLHAESVPTQPKAEETPSWIQRIALKSSKVLEKLRQRPPEKGRPPIPALRPSESTA